MIEEVKRFKQISMRLPLSKYLRLKMMALSLDMGWEEFFSGLCYYCVRAVFFHQDSTTDHVYEGDEFAKLIYDTGNRWRKTFKNHVYQKGLITLGKKRKLSYNEYLSIFLY